MPADFVAPPSIPEDENWVTSQCPQFYAEDALMLSQVIYLGLLWLGLIVLLNPGVTIGKFTKKYLKPRWWLIINSIWIWVVCPRFPSSPRKCRPTTQIIPSSRSSIGLVHFTEYPLNPDYSEFTLEEILIYNTEAHIRETVLIGCEETWITIQPLLFCNKYNYLPAYLVPMTHPLNLRPNHPQESVATSESTYTQIFGVM
ncbi:hypothetical protein DSO57_1010788 [Entomophthora muscae]|uniref:Uncharacterized protein n=1 Tax=Entomophthora muscae TaxID=34485 RepID=A0ACC2URQ7_9FUNG|nr:hypothetical protein DSO57_1010788 [Entomophthora muscae]